MKTSLLTLDERRLSFLTRRHPSGEIVVVSCLDGLSYTSHLAVIDVTKEPPQLLYHLPVKPVPEGIEFSPCPFGKRA